MLGRVKLKLALLVVVASFTALGWTFVKRPLPVPKGIGPVLPSAHAVEGVSLSLICGARMESREGFSVRGGSLLKPFTTGIVAFVIDHPRGTLLVDAGVGRNVEAHLQTTPLLMRALATLAVDQPTVDALHAHGLEPKDVEGIILTHSHWDHVSGLEDLRGVPVWITPEELVFARSGDPGGKLYRQLEAEGPFELRELTFPDGAYGPFEATFDFFEDGSVLVVPLPGHTPGSIGVLITEHTGRRVLVIGDTSWTKEGVEWPAEKPWLARRLVDHDAPRLREQLVLLHQFQLANPELLIVPAHDARVHEAIASFRSQGR